MLKILGAVIAVFAVVFSIGSVQQSVKDGITAITHWTYYPYRDMRRTVAFIPNHGSLTPPAPGTVPTKGVERTYGLEGVDLATKLGETLVNPVAADDSSLARGERKFIKTCVPCHGPQLAGDGPVAALFMPPPDLLGEATRQRRDGYLYSYMRHGGAVMPPYGAQVTAQEAWDVVNYVRHQQKVNPR